MADKKSKIIDGLSFEITQPYDAGHVINEAEAKALNQVRSENIGNNLRKTVVEYKAEGKEAELADIVAKYDADYIFTLASVGGSARSADPVEREAMSIAKALVKDALKAQGRKISDVPEGLTKEQWEEKLQGNYERVANSAEVLAEAKKAVDAKRKRMEKLSALEL